MQRVIPSVIITLSLLLAIVVPAGRAIAQAEEIAKQAALFGLKQLASMGYDSNCNKSQSIDSTDQIGNVVCDALASQLGRKESEFREDVRAGLIEINGRLSNIEMSLETLSANQGRMEKALDLISLKIDTIPFETAAATARITLDTIWNDRFLPILVDPDSFTRKNAVDLARDLTRSDSVHRQMGVVVSAFTKRSSQGTLLGRHLSQVLVATDPGSDLETPYRLLEAIMTDVLADHTRAEIMYAWSAAILAADCSRIAEEDSSDTCYEPTQSLTVFRGVADEQRQRLMNEFNLVIDRMVLQNSDHIRIEAGFLHHDAVSVFAMADYFTASALREGFGMRGRVVSTGEAFSGTIRISGTNYRDKGARTTDLGHEIDWWTRPSEGQPYDTLHFGPSWKVHYFSESGVVAGDYDIESRVPWDSGTILVRTVDITTGLPPEEGADPDAVIDFGSFLAIARAGGAYAVMSDAWDISPSKASGTSTQPELSQYLDGSVIWEAEQLFPPKPKISKSTFSSSVDRKRSITFVDGGEITMTLHSGPAAGRLHPAHTGVFQSPEAPAERATITYFVDYTQFGTENEAAFDIVTKLSAVSERDEHEIAWSVNKSVTKRSFGEVRQPATKSATFNFESGVRYELWLQQRVKFSIPPSGLEPTKYNFFTGLSPEAIHFSRD